jgi:S-methylmethionine-dependent homocysteine/selenocysteine methylase
MDKEKLILIDGGMGQELIYRSKIKPDNLWSARVMLDNYNLVVDLHKDFIKAGAEAITLNTYSVTPQKLKRNNLEDMFNTLQKSAIKAANQAIHSSETEKKIQLLGCLPPLIMSYKASIGMEKKEAIETYQRIVDIQQPFVDIFCCETVCSIEEAIIVTEVALQSDKKVWLSFCVKEEDGTTLRSGEKLEDALKEFDTSEVNSFLVNCAPPEAISKSINVMKNFSKPFGGLPNGFETVNFLDVGNDVSILEKRNDFSIDKFVQDMLSYIRNNASIVGGCCEVSPEYISAVRDKILSLN